MRAARIARMYPRHSSAVSGTVSHAACYPVRHGIPCGTVSRAKRYPMRHGRRSGRYGMGTAVSHASMNPNFYQRGDVIPGMKVSACSTSTREYLYCGKPYHHLYSAWRPSPPAVQGALAVVCAYPEHVSAHICLCVDICMHICLSGCGCSSVLRHTSLWTVSLVSECCGGAEPSTDARACAVSVAVRPESEFVVRSALARCIGKGGEPPKQPKQRRANKVRRVVLAGGWDGRARRA